MTFKKKLLIYVMLLVSVMTFCSVDRLHINKVYAAGANLALNKEAFGSGMYNEQGSYAPDKINDGNYFTLWSDGNVKDGTGTLTGVVAGYYYIAVDLADEYILNQIIAYPRIDFDDSAMLHNWYIQLSNTRDFSDAVTVAHIESKCEYGGKFVFNVELEESYRYVRIASPKSFFTCGELEVFGEKYDPVTMSGKHNFIDAQDQRYNAAAAVCDALGIINATGKASFEGEKMLTRAAATKAIVTMMNYAVDKNEKSIYSDVPEDYWAKEYIMAAYRNNIISKSDKFRPDEYVTQGELCKMIIYAFGYDVNAGLYGDWRTATSDISSSLRLLKNAGGNFDDKLSRGIAAQIIYNALLAPMNDLLFSENNNSPVLEPSDKTALYDLYEMRIVEGIVTENVASTLTHSTNTRKDHIMIDNEAFLDSDGLMQRMIGKKAGVLVDSDGDIVTGFEDTLINQITRIYDSSFVSAQGGVYTYEEEGKERRIRFDEQEVYVIRNYSAIPDWTYADFEPSDGYIEFIDNDRDGEIEVVSILKPEIVIGGYVLPSNGDVNIVGHNGSKIAAVEPAWTRFMRNGKVTTPGKFMSNDVIFVYKSDNDAILFVDGYSDSVTGTVGAVKDDAVVIDNVEYELSEYYINLKSNNPNSDELLKLSEESTVLLDGRNRIICAVKENNNIGSDIVGFVSKVYSDIAEETCGARIFTDNGEFVTYDFADSVRIDDRKIKYDDLVTEIDAGVININNEVIKFRVNSSGKINRIEILEDSGVNLGSNIVYINNGYGIYNKGWLVQPLRPNTMCLTIPKSGNDYLYGGYEQQYLVGTVSDYMSELSQIEGQWDFYDVDDLGYPSVAVRYREVASFGMGLRAVSSAGAVGSMIVEKVNTYYDEENNAEAYSIKGFDMHGNKKTIKLDSEITSIFKADDLQGDKFTGEDNDCFDDDKDIITDKLTAQDITTYTMSVKDLKTGDLIRYEMSEDLAVAVERTYGAYSGKNGVYERNIDGTYYSSGKMYPQYPDAEYRLVYGLTQKIIDDTFIMNTCQRNGINMTQYVQYMNLGKLMVCNGRRIEVYEGSLLPAYFRTNQEALLFTSDRAKPVCMILYE